MSTRGWESIRVDEIDPIAVAGVNWRPLRRSLGVRAFGVNAYTGSTGEQVVESHTEEHLRHEEIYVVLTGRATFSIADDEVDAPAGTIVFLSDPALRRGAVATADDTTVLAIGGRAGEPYTPSAWEAYFAVERFRASGDHVAALAELEEALAEHPGNPGVVYSLACWNALAGDEESALRLALEAIELEPRYAEWARQDDDLASIRDRLPDS